MRALKTLVASAALALALPSFSAPLVLDFETTTVTAPVLETYSSLGIHFSSSALVAKSRAFNGDGNFYGPGGVLDNIGAVTTTGLSSFTITIDNGFDDFFSLIYAGEASTTISAYDKTGALIGTTSGSGTAICGGNFACNWSPLALSLGSSAAYSITVEGTVGKDWYDNLSFGNLLPAVTPPGGTVPEPGSVALSLAALGALAWSRKRSKS